jgi:glycosyltransferase involved in cell wall biosynthesis
VRILIFISSLSSGGAERVAVSLASYWASKGCEVSIVTLAGTEMDFYDVPHGVGRVSLGMASASSGTFAAVRKNLTRVGALRSLLRASCPDVAISFMDQSNVLLAASSLGLKNLGVIGSERIHPPRHATGRAWSFLRRYFYSYLDAVVAQTGQTAEWLRRHTMARDVEVIPNPVNVPLPVRSPIIAPPNRQSDERLLLAVGRLCHQKGFDLLIKSFAMVAARFLNWKLCILGEGRDRGALEQQIRNLGLSGRVHLPGRAGNVGQWYQSADIYVMSSRFEGFPNTLLEAMAYGVPSVSFDCDTGPRDIIRDGVNGLLITDGDDQALAHALGRLMGAPDLRRRFSRAAVSVAQKYSMEVIGKSWDSLIQKVVA